MLGPVRLVHVALHVVLGVEDLVAEAARVLARHVLRLDVAAQVAAGRAVVAARLAPVRPLRVPRDVVLHGGKPALNKRKVNDCSRIDNDDSK